MRVRVAGILIAAAFTASFAAGCGGDPSAERFTLQARGGTYVDGTGRLGLAVLVTLRDGKGFGPSTEWKGALSGPAGRVADVVTYSAPREGSWIDAWWPEEIGYAGTYTLDLGAEGGGGLSTVFELGEGFGIPPPQPSVTEGGASISWSSVAEASAYGCRAYGDAGVMLSWVGSATSCDLSALPPGAYVVSVFAYSADLVAIAASASRRPALPDRFDVSEARVVLERTGGGSAIAVLGAAGGGFADGTSWWGPQLAVWISILNWDGSPTTVPWTVEVVGPGLPATEPLTFEYPANFSRIMVRADVPASAGSYGVIARSIAGSVARPFTVGTVNALDAPTGVVASAGAQGSATVQWSAVSGARSYLVSARHHASGEFAMNQWVAGPSASFPAGTFDAGATYDAYVAATDADMVGGTPPTQFAITENSIQPASFVAR